ncbi:MAG: DUF58 domain-containing protein [candidate division WOR-3 bacterium]
MRNTVSGLVFDSIPVMLVNCYMRPSGTSLLKPELIARLKGIDFKARLVVEGFLSGLHRSPYKGFSVEFAEYRQYMPGDELKRIDWRVYGRTGRFFVREYEEETNLRAYLVLDASASMNYPATGYTKLDYGRWLAASLALLLNRQKDSTGLVTFSGKIDRYIPPRATGAHLRVLFRELENLKPGGETDISTTLHELAERIRRRGLVILISDLWDDATAVVAALRHFRARKHELLVFHLFHPDEATLGFSNPVLLRDLETGQEITVDPRQIQYQYQDRFNRRCEYFRRACAEARVDYQSLSTATPFEETLFTYLERRRRLH